MKYDVMVSVTITPKDEGMGYSSLLFSRRFELEGQNFTEVAGKVDFIYDTIEGRAHERNDRRDP